MKIIYRALTEKEVARARIIRLRSFVAFMSLGVVLALIVMVLGTPYGMRPAGWPWTPADAYGVNLGLLLGGMLAAGGILAFYQLMLHVNSLARRQSTRIVQFAVPMTVLSLTLLLSGVLVLARMTLVTWWANSDGWRPGLVWLTPRSSEPILHVAIAPDSQTMYAWTKSGVRSWLLGRGKELSAANAPPPGPQSLSSAALAHEKRLAAAGVVLESAGANRLTLLAKDGKERNLMPQLLGAVTSLALSGDGSLALAGCSDGRVHVWDGASGRELPILAGKSHTLLKSPVSAVALSPDGLSAASGHENGVVRHWNLKTGNDLQDLRDKDQTSPSPISVLAFDSAGKQVAAMAAQTGTFYVWNVDDYKMRRVETGLQDATHLAVSADGRYAIIVANGAIHVLRL